MKPHVVCLLFLFSFVVIETYADDLSDKLKLGLSNVKDEFVDAEVVVEMGEIPEWLHGSFIRHACGAFGETGSDAPIVNQINHLFDCIEMGQSFQFQDGEATFYNRYYNTTKMEIYRNYQMNMNDSRVYWRTVLGDFDADQRDLLQPNMSQPGRISGVDHVSWWTIGQNAAAWSETTNGVMVDVHNVEAIERYRFSDNNMGYPGGTAMVNNPAHPHRESDGTVWSAVMVTTADENPRFRLPRWAVYDVRDDFRRVIAEVPVNTIDLGLCSGDDEYPDLSGRLGYMHSFSMTENYIILPATSWLFDPCAYFIHGSYPDSAFFGAVFKWHGEHPSYLYVIRKSDGQLMASIPTEAFFVTHQMNSYEQDGKMYLDMLTFANSSIYTYHTFTPQLLHNSAYPTSVERFTVNMADWTLESRTDLRPPGESVEFSNINYEHFNTRPYKFSYMGKNIFRTGGEILKLNVDTRDEVAYVLPEGFFPQEPVFVATPGSQEEDDGVLLVQGLDANKAKGFLVILDARTMEPITHVTAPGLTLFGLHNRFYTFDQGNNPRLNSYSAAPRLGRNITWLSLLLSVAFAIFA